jgi:hypothetical protein
VSARKPTGVPRKPRDPDVECSRCNTAPATITEHKPLATGSVAFYPYCSHCWHVPGPSAPSPAERTGVDALRVYDNGGKSIDRYTVVGVDGERDNDNMKSMLGVSEGGRAFSQFCRGHEGRHLGKRLPFASLDDDTRAHILSRLAPEVAKP